MIKTPNDLKKELFSIVWTAPIDLLAVKRSGSYNPSPQDTYRAKE